MTVFWLVAIVMLITAVTFALSPLLRQKSLLLLSQDELNIDLARERLQEWRTALENEVISEAEFDDLRSELEDTLIIELSSQAPVETKHQPRPYLAIALGVLLPFVIIGLYLQLGTPSALLPNNLVGSSTTLKDTELEGSAASIDVMLVQLQDNLEKNPNDEHGWSILAHAMMSLKRYPEALQAYEALLQLVGSRPDVLVRYAEALAMMAGGNFNGRPTDALEKALAVDPLQPQGLWLSGIAARDRGNLRQALTHWYQLEPLLVDQTQSLDDLQRVIAKTEEAALNDGIALPDRSKLPIIEQSIRSSDRVEIKIRVEIDPEISSLISAGDVLFIYARAASAARPVAAIRHPISEWPMEFILDDASSVMRTSPLSSFDTVEIGAHVSHSGQAIAQRGDLVAETVTTPIDDGTVVQIKISEVLP